MEWARIAWTLVLGWLLLLVDTTRAGCDDCTVLPHLPCRIVNNPGLYSECALHHGNEQELYPGRPSNLRVTALTRGKKMLLNISWSIPADASYRHVKGFRLKIHTLSGHNVNKQICILFNLTRAAWKLSDLKSLVSFKYECVEVSPDTKYDVQVYSLPLPFSTPKHDTFAITRFKTPPSCNMARVSFTVVNSTERCHISVHLNNFGPESCGFKTINIDLIKKIASTDFLANRTKLIKPDRNFTFINVNPGEYVVRVQPLNDNSVCHPYQSCLTTQSKEKTINGNGVCIPGGINPGEPGEPTPDPPHSDAIKIASAVLASCVGVTLAVIVIYFVYRKKPGPPGPDTKPTMHNLYNSEKVTDEVEILIIFSKDYDLHTEVVVGFAEYMRNHCGCKVHLVDWEWGEIMKRGHMGWLVEKIDKVQKIIIVHSEGGFIRYTRDQDRRHSEVGEDLIKDMFIEAVKLIQPRFSQERDKYFNVYFDYTAPKYLIRFFADSPKYILMKDIEGLFLHLHGQNKRERGKHSVSARGITNSEYCQTDEGSQLRNSIDKCREHLLKNPNHIKDNIVTPIVKRKETSPERSVSIDKDSGISIEERQREEMRHQNDQRLESFGNYPSGKLSSEIPANMDVHLHIPPKEVESAYFEQLLSANPSFPCESEIPTSGRRFEELDCNLSYNSDEQNSSITTPMSLFMPDISGPFDLSYVPQNQGSPGLDMPYPSFRPPELAGGDDDLQLETILSINLESKMGSDSGLNMSPQYSRQNSRNLSHI